jgi:hypothetical protein
MELTWVCTQKILRYGRASLLYCTRLPHLIGGADGLEECYRQGAQAQERYAVDTLLPQLERTIAEAPRRNRLHATVPTLELLCDGEVVEDRWISLTLTRRLTGEQEKVCRDHRVWDGKTGLLCPIEHFVTPREARGYCRWTFFLQEGEVWGICTKKGGNNPICTPKRIGKMKNLSMRS